MIPISKKILLLIILFVFLSHNIFSDDSELANLYYQSGLTLMKENKCEEAIVKFNKALSFRKGFPSVLFNLGECYKKLNNNKKALKNYRLCIKSLNQIFRAKEDEELLSQVYRSMDKMDTNGKRFTTIRDNYTSGIFLLANDCANKKLTNFAYQLFQLVLQVDPSNKSAQELLSKLGTPKITPLKPSAEKPAKTELPPPPIIKKDIPQNLFNGKDIDEWETKAKYPEASNVWGGVTFQNWCVKDGKIEGNPRVAGSEVFLLWKGIIPANYILTVKFAMERNRSSRTDPIGIVYGGSEVDSFDITSLSGSVCPSGVNVNKLELTKQGDKYKFSFNGKVLKQDLSNKFSPTIGLMVQNALVYFHSITLQTIK